MPTYRLYFSWLANPEPAILGYRLYFGFQSGVYNHPESPQEMGNVTHASYLVPDATGIWHFALTSRSALGESPFSAELVQDFFGLEAVGAF